MRAFKNAQADDLDLLTIFRAFQTIVVVAKAKVVGIVLCDRELRRPRLHHQKSPLPREGEAIP